MVYAYNYVIQIDFRLLHQFCDKTFLFSSPFCESLPQLRERGGGRNFNTLFTSLLNSVVLLHLSCFCATFVITISFLDETNFICTSLLWSSLQLRGGRGEEIWIPSLQSIMLVYWILNCVTSQWCFPPLNFLEQFRISSGSCVNKRNTWKIFRS